MPLPKQQAPAQRLPESAGASPPQPNPSPKDTRPMDELDKLALEAQKHPANSKARKKALTKLVMAIQASGKLYCKGRYDCPPEVYNEALQEVWLYVCKNIDSYDPSKGKVISWVNNTLKWRFRDAADRHLNRKRVSQDNQREWVQTLSLDVPVTPDSDGESGETYLDSIAQNQPSMLLQELRDYIQEDPEGVFQKRHITNFPEANDQAIALLYLADYSWDEIVAAFGARISQGTISGFSCELTSLLLNASKTTCKNKSSGLK